MRRAHGSSCVLVLTVLAAAIGGAALSARQSPAPAVPQFRSSVDTVHLDVSVLDRSRRPVRGLMPADFTILEDGKPQQVAVFQAVDIPDPAPPSAPWMREVALDIGSNDGVQDRRLFLILMDDMTMQADVAAVNKARDIARQVIDRLSPSDLAAVIFTRDNRHAQDYTADVARLRAAVDKFTIGFRDMGLFDAEAQALVAGQDDYFYTSSVDVLDRAVEVLSALPDRRKAIVYVGQGLPVDLDFLAPQPAGLPSGGGSSGQMQGAMAGRIATQMARIFRNANRANVNVYTVDPCGLRAYSYRKFPAPTCVPGLEVNYLRTLAAATGGRAVADTNDVVQGVADIFRENASYYLLGYRPAGSGSDGKFHRLDVRVNRSGVEVRTRIGYQAEKPHEAKKRIAAMAAMPLGAAISGILPKSDLPLQLSAVALAQPGRKESAIAIVVGVRQPIRQTAGRAVERVDLQVSAFDVNGKAFGSRRLRADVAIRAGAGGLAEYEVLSRLELAPGRYQLRIAGHIGSLATSGSLYHDVDVPDVSKQAVALSALMFSVSPGLVAAPPDALKGLVPVNPTTRRAFASADRVAAFARVYQRRPTAAAPLPVRVRIVNDTGAEVFARSQDLTADRFTPSGTADIVFDLPNARLPAGEYLLTVEVGAGATAARRQVRFRALR